MAFGYKLPNFNVWGRHYYRLDNGSGPDSFFGPRYFRCQMKRQNFVFSNTLLVPPRLGFRPIEQTPSGLGDVVQVAGNDYMYWIVVSVWEVGAGFPNEHRELSLVPPQDMSLDSASSFFFPAVNTALEPPEGAPLLGATTPADFWNDPAIFFL